MNELINLGIFAIIAIYSFIVYRRWWQMYKQMEELLHEHYEQRGLEIVSISKLSATDRFKYGVPWSPFISFYTSSFRFLRAGKETVCRSIETRNESGAEQIRYVEIGFSGTEEISVNEFEVYEF